MSETNAKMDVDEADHADAPDVDPEKTVVPYSVSDWDLDRLEDNQDSTVG